MCLHIGSTPAAWEIPECTVKVLVESWLTYEHGKSSTLPGHMLLDVSSFLLAFNMAIRINISIKPKLRVKSQLRVKNSKPGRMFSDILLLQLGTNRVLLKHPVKF